MSRELRYRLYVHWLARALAEGIPERWLAELVMDFHDVYRNPPINTLVRALSELAKRANVRVDWSDSPYAKAAA